MERLFHSQYIPHRSIHARSFVRPSIQLQYVQNIRKSIIIYLFSPTPLVCVCYCIVGKCCPMVINKSSTQLVPLINAI